MKGNGGLVKQSITPLVGTRTFLPTWKNAESGKGLGWLGSSCYGGMFSVLVTRFSRYPSHGDPV